MCKDCQKGVTQEKLSILICSLLLDVHSTANTAITVTFIITSTVAASIATTYEAKSILTKISRSI